MKSFRIRIKFFYFIILILWVLFSVLRTFNNVIRFVREDIGLISFSDNQNRHVVYGELIDFCNAVSRNTEDESRILFLSSGAKPFYFCRYQIYPRKLYFIRSSEEAVKQLKLFPYDYLLVYKSHDPQENENNSDSWNLTGINTTIIYKSVKAEGSILRL